MTLSMSQASIPVFVQLLTAASAVLDKAAAHAEAKKVDPTVLLNMRLYPDMFPLVRQIQIATDQAKGCIARLAGMEVPKYPDSEATFDEIKARIAKTIDFVQSVKASQIDGTEDKDLTIPLGQQQRAFKGQAYLINFVLPNFYFHLATAYNILRHAGVEIGKRDFLGNF
ncbi:MAG: hypothetical protein JWL84_2250 [Rhodospirillales bacterium]|jgi:hypothetical protein|nr:hypothetical protein [Rhodospirillales bacterium]